VIETGQTEDLHRSFTGYLIGLSWVVLQAAIYFARLVYLGVRDRLTR
jgi:hypothetical protein